ncbi:MAG: GntR family transcriptional regulator [Bacteroidales bacterium]|nr:GntR family transcriptional regulator [Bacteroidales bacterium]
MDFNSTRPIYLQICDEICEKILSGALAPEDRIASVREYGAGIGVNPNTVMRSYEKLTGDGIIYNKRGIGYFVSPDAAEKVLQEQREEFLQNELPGIIRKMQLLGIDPAEVLKA